MAWSGGNFTRANPTWVSDASAGIGIEAARHDSQDNDFTTGINQCLNKDGSNAATGNLNLGGFLPTNIGAGTAAAPALCMNNDTNTGLFSPAADQIGIATNGTERVRISDTGRVGIGTTAPTSALQVTGQIDGIPDAVGVHIGMVGTAYGCVELVGSTGSIIDFTDAGVDNKGRIIYTNADNSMVFATASVGSRLRLGGTGAVSINSLVDGVGYFNVQFDGSTDDFSAGRNITGANYVVSKSIYDKTTVSGANVAVESTGGSYPVRRSTSSIKYKKDVVDLEPVFADKLHQFRPVFFKSKCFGDHPEWTHYGFIAEELAEIEPRFVSFGYQPNDYEDYEFVDDQGNTQTAQRLKADAKPEPEGVYYDRIVTFLTSVVQRQEKRIEALESRVAELEA